LENALTKEDRFQLLLFATDPDIIRIADKTGIYGYMVDLETRGKKARQTNYDTQISEATQDDLLRVRACTDRPVICRINGFHGSTADEVETVIAAGADEIFLPMVRTPEQVARTLDMIRGRCGLAILVETVEAVRLAKTLGQFPLSRVYVGLNDLAIERGLKNIFSSVSDGMVESVRSYSKVPFGFGGLTLPEFGFPIPCRLLIGEMARLDCQFTFLRRSFYRDIKGKDLNLEVPRILDALRDARTWSENELRRNQTEFAAAVAKWGEDSIQGEE
jgi:hypothetical protein